MLYSEEEEERIIEMYESCSGNTAEAERRLKVGGIDISRMTIKSRWEAKGFKLNSHGGTRKRLDGRVGNLTELQIDEIVEEYGGSFTRTAKRVGHSEETVTKYLKIRGIIQ